MPARIDRPKLDRAFVRHHGLAGFTRLAWRHTVPEARKWNWHHDVVCAHLEKLYYGEIRNLLIEIPPGTTKSLLCQVFFPAWAWTVNPAEKGIFATYEVNLCKKFARQMRDLVMSGWYQERWPEASIPFQNTRAAGLFQSSAGGFRFSSGTGGAVTGNHAGILVGDDLLKAQAAMGAGASTLTEINAAWDFWSKVLPTRQIDPKTTRRLLIQQRLHFDDPAGRWARHDPSVVRLCLPMEYDPDHPHAYAGDPRSEPGELLWPDHIPREAVESLKRDLGPLDAAAQLQQLPGRIGGEVFRLEWLSNHWKQIRISSINTGLISCDLTFGGKRDNASYIALGVWALVGQKACLVDQVRVRASYLETRSLIKVLAAKYPWARPILVENKANGPAILEDLRREIAGMVPHEPKGSKLARAHAVTGYFEAGDVLLPDPQGAVIEGQRVDTSWVADYVLEMNRFTGADADVSDQVDQTSQALSRFYQSPARGFVDAMSAVARDLGFA